MRRILLPVGLVIGLVLMSGSPPTTTAAGAYTLVGWNNLGMHCMDADFSVFSILPPYNTILAQLVSAHQLVTIPTGFTVTYEAVDDPAASINTTSQGKTNFWTYVQDLYGPSLALDMGLAGKAMPGPSNTPKAMDFDPNLSWWIAEGIPITPADDAQQRNPYPMMRLVARDGTGAVIATTDIVLPVSDEMDCRACHASGSDPAAEPSGGWANDSDPQIDYRKNVLLLHDDRQGGTTKFTQALSTAGYDPSGLYTTAISNGKPILCAKCHGSNALPGTGIAGVPPLTDAAHGYHAHVTDPNTGTTLDASDNRTACYRCHPGSATRCLRGVMGASVAPDGTPAIQCQSCHGTMSAVGDPNRQGWLDEPNCQNCHTGTAAHNNGQIRYTTAFDTTGARRAAVDSTFATTPNVPASGFSLYRFSYGHGGLKCEACHGSTHAEYPSTHVNDNVQTVQIQAHVGPLAECTACHASSPTTVTGGPHGMHPVGQAWIGAHPDKVENTGASGCAGCHGTDYRGTVLSYVQMDRSVTAFGATKNFWRGFQVGCYACHRGPGNDQSNPNRPPVVQNATAQTLESVPLNLPLQARDPDGNAMTLRVVSQPAHGTVALNGTTATYYPEVNYTGSDSFTFAAWDGSINSNLGTVSLTVGTNNCSLTCTATVPATANEGASVSFQATATPTTCVGTPVFTWDFGDGQGSSAQNTTHTYATSGTFSWSMNVSVAGHTCSKGGTLIVNGLPPTVTSVKRASNPTRIIIKGTNFHASMQVTIGTTAWTNLTRKGTTQVVLKGGSALKALFPKNTWMPMYLVNPDDGLHADVEFNWTANRWR